MIDEKLLNDWLAEFNAPEKDWSYETFLGFEDYLTITHKVLVSPDGKLLIAATIEYIIKQLSELKI